jgi:hypothetical protein
LAQGEAQRARLAEIPLPRSFPSTLYDCDFNQMLDLPVAAGAPRTIFEANPAALAGQETAVGPHCFRVHSRCGEFMRRRSCPHNP